MENEFRYLFTYLVSQGEYPEIIAQLFGVDTQSVLDANKLSEDQVIYYFTPLMVPLRYEPPTKIERTLLPLPRLPPPVANPVKGGDSSSSKKWVVVGITIGVALLLLLIIFMLFFCFCRRNKKTLDSAATKITTEKVLDTSNSTTNPSSSLSFEGLHDAAESLTVYNIEELHKATNFFCVSNRIKGSVYHAILKGDDAAVKILKGDVSGEINMLRRMNRANITRLSGFCVHKGSTYLVCEFAENGSLNDKIHSNDKSLNSGALTWKQRVQMLNTSWYSSLSSCEFIF